MLDNKLSALQQELLNMLKWFDAFCREHELRYFAVGGTLLGAVRHNGFIPWDDDVDVAMPRPDYEKLAELMGDKIIDHYTLETASSLNRDFCFPYSKLYDVNTTLVENYKTPLVRGAFLDIFPLDGLGYEKDAAIAFSKMVQKKRKFYLTRVAAKRKGRKFYKNLALSVSQLIPESIIDNTKLRIELDSMCKKYPYDINGLGGALLGIGGPKEVFPLKVFGTPTEYQFEDMKLLGVEDYNSYLSSLYGDWRKLPPKEKQVSEHDYISLDLNRSFLNGK